MGLAKLIRALQRGGVALRCGEGGYRVWRCQNRKRRALGVMRAIDGDALRADGKIILMEGEHALYHWVGSVEGLVRGKPVPPPAVLLPRRKRRAGRGLLARALDEAVDERDRQRLADAAARFLGDVERAAQPQHVTMNWSSLALGSIDGTRSHGNNLPGYSSARALERLKAARAALGVLKTKATLVEAA